MAAVCFLFLFVLLAKSGADSSVFKGKGDACFASYFPNKTGVIFIYRPEEYETYSPLGRGWKASVMWYGTKSKRYTKHEYTEKVIVPGSAPAAPMRWSEEGKYYYYEQTNGTFKAHDWIGYAVYITDRVSQQIYEDTYHFYKVSPDFGHCEIDNIGGYQHQCSKALTDAISYQKELMEKPAVTPYKGKGKVYVAGMMSSLPPFGLRFIYQPENYQKYSPEGQGWIAYVSYEWSTSSEDARANYSKILASREVWPILTWDAKGKYYYYDDYRHSLMPGLFGYGVDIVNTDGQLIYKDLYNYYYNQYKGLEASCYLDSTNSPGNLCSQALEELGNTGSPHAAHHFPTDNYYTDNEDTDNDDTDNDGTNSSDGASVAGIVVPCVLVFAFLIGIRLICCIRANRRYAQSSRRFRRVILPENPTTQRNVSATNPAFLQARVATSIINGMRASPASSVLTGNSANGENATSFAPSARVGNVRNGENTCATNPTFFHYEEQTRTEDGDTPTPSTPPPSYDESQDEVRA